MSIDQSTLNKGQIRKLNALRKSVGDDIADVAFGKWMKSQTKTPKETRDLLQTHLSLHLRTSTTTRVSSWEIRVMSYAVQRARECQGLLLRRCPEETSTQTPSPTFSVRLPV